MVQQPWCWWLVGFCGWRGGLSIDVKRREGVLGCQGVDSMPVSISRRSKRPTIYIHTKESRADQIDPDNIRIHKYIPALTPLKERMRKTTAFMAKVAAPPVKSVLSSVACV